MPRLTWGDLLIQDITADQFRDWLSPWTGVVTGRVAPAFMSKFGFWFLRRPEGHVEMLDVFTGRLEPIADSYEDFIREVNEQWWQETYLFSESVFEFHQAEKIPGPGQCYALAPHPALGGPNPSVGDAIDPKFVSVADVSVWQSICASVRWRGALTPIHNLDPAPFSGFAYFTAAQTRCTSSCSSSSCRNSPTSCCWASVSSAKTFGMKPISLVITVHPLAESHLETVPTSVRSQMNFAPAASLGMSSFCSCGQRLDFVGSGFDGGCFEVNIRIRVMRFDQADVVEDELVGARRGQLALAEQHAEFRRGAIDVVGVNLDDDRHVVRRAALIDDVLHHQLFLADAGPLVDGALDGVLGNALFFRFFNGGKKPGVHRRIWIAHPGGEGDFAHQLGVGLGLLKPGDQSFCVQPLASHVPSERYAPAKTDEIFFALTC